MEAEVQKPSGPSNGEKQLLERFVLNAMKIAAGTNYDDMLMQAQSAQNGAQSVARALLFVVNAVKKGLESKGIKIPGSMYIAENGIFSQVARIVSALLMKAGLQIQPEEVTQAIEMVATQMASDYDRQEAGASEQPSPEEQQALAQQQAAAQQPQDAPQQPQQPQQGLLPQGGMQ